MIKININRVVVRDDETPWVKEFDPQPGIRVLVYRDFEWRLVEGVPKSHITFLDLFRAVFSCKQQQEKKESLRRKGELLKKVNSAAKKRAPLAISGADVDFIVEQAEFALDTIPFIQLDDVLHERPTLGDPEPEVDEEAVTEERTHDESAANS